MMRDSFIRIFGRAESRPAAQVEADIRDELDLHVAYLERELLQAGAGPEVARSQAAQRFGDAESFGRECRSIALKEHVMIQRINCVLLVIVAGGLGFALVDASRTQRANRRAMEAFTTRLEALSAPGALQAPMTRPANYLTDLPWVALSWDDPPRELAGAARPNVPSLEKLRCFDTPAGWLFCTSDKTARLLAEDIKEAALAFKKYFGVDPPRGAVYMMGAAVKGDVTKELRDAGAAWTMPWNEEEDEPPAGADKGALRKEVEKQVREQLKEQGINDEAVVQAQVDAAAMKFGADPSRALRHELGHEWLIRVFWGDKELGDRHDADKKRVDKDDAEIVIGHEMHYGGPAADWLDEVAAILMEDDALTENRRRHLASVMTDHPESLIPFKDLFTMEHPVSAGEGLGSDPEVKEAIEKAKREALQKMLDEGSTSYSTVVTIPLVKDADLANDRAVIFYQQLRSVADFILARSRNERIFRDITLAEVEGMTIDKWLETSGAQAGLPSTIDKFEAEWKVWAGEKAKATKARE